MSESININENIRHFMVLDVISRKIEAADKSKRTMKMKNAEAIESLKVRSYFDYHFLLNKIRVFVPNGLSREIPLHSISVLAIGGVTIFDS